MKFLIFIILLMVIAFGVRVWAEDKAALEDKETKPAIYHSIEFGNKMWLGTTELSIGVKEISFKSASNIKTRIINPANVIVRDE